VGGTLGRQSGHMGGGWRCGGKWLLASFLLLTVGLQARYKMAASKLVDNVNSKKDNSMKCASKSLFIRVSSTL
jgi:hypothetical protein